jgi:hypothetical protein
VSQDKKQSSTSKLKDAVKKGGTRKSPAHAFFDQDEQSIKTDLQDQKNITEDKAVTGNNEQPAVTDSDDVQPEAASKTVRDVGDSIMSMYDEKSKKKTVEETHNRATFLFRKDLQERLDKLSEGKRGFKTMFLNKAIEVLLDEIEGVHDDQ